MFRYLITFALLGISALALAAVYSIFLFGNSTVLSNAEEWTRACGISFTPCYNLVKVNTISGLAFINNALLEDTFRVASISIAMVVLMMVFRSHRKLYRLLFWVIGSSLILLLVLGTLTIFDSGYSNIIEATKQSVKTLFISIGVVATLFAVGMTIRAALQKTTRGIHKTFVIRTAHSTQFPPKESNKTREGGETKESGKAQEDRMIGDIDETTGCIRISVIYNKKEMRSRNLEWNKLARISWKDTKGRERSIYRRLKKLTGKSVPGDIRPKASKSGQKITGVGEFPLCILHIEDKPKLFPGDSLWSDNGDRAELELEDGDRRDFAKLTIQKAAFWDWFYYVFDHPDPAVAWSFRVGLWVTFFFMIFQITIFEPLVSP